MIPGIVAGGVGAGGGGAIDPHFANVSLLCHFNGADASTSFPDNSASPKTLTANGNAQVDTAQSMFGGASALFDGSGDFISTPAHSDFNMGGGDFTVEFWVRFLSLTGTQTVVGQAASSGSNSTVSFVVQKDSGNKIAAFGCSASTAVGITTGVTSVTAGVWYHVAYTRAANTFRLFLNGIQEATVTQGVTLNSSSFALSIGRLGEFNGQYVNGWVDDLRITKGVARYTANFTPPAAQFPDS